MINTSTSFPASYVVYDFETTGLLHESPDVIEIGAMRVENNEIVATKSWMIRNVKPLPAKITEITGITDEMLKDGIPEFQAFQEFAGFAVDAPLVGHNILRYDNILLKHKASAYTCLGAFEEGMRASVDTAALYKALKLGRTQNLNESLQEFSFRVLNEIAPVKFNLALAFKELGFEDSSITAHRALGDIQMTHEIYKKMKAA